MNARAWISAYAEKLGTSAPTEDEWEVILDLAGEAAHGSERVAAPVACWVAARAGISPARALELARNVRADD